MAKVIAPLGSFSASGKIGKAVVYFPHLGRNVVRGLVIPANPKSETQGDSRLMLGALGRAVKAIANPSDARTDLLAAVPAGQTFGSFLVRNVMAIFGKGQAGVAALTTAAGAHAATNWEAQGTAAGLTDLTVPYAGTIKTITKGDQLYAIAAHCMNVAASNPALFARAPYTTELASWDSADVVSFVADLQSEA